MIIACLTLVMHLISFFEYCEDSNVSFRFFFFFFNPKTIFQLKSLLITIYFPLLVNQNFELAAKYYQEVLTEIRTQMHVIRRFRVPLSLSFKASLCAKISFHSF